MEGRKAGTSSVKRGCGSGWNSGAAGFEHVEKGKASSGGVGGWEPGGKARLEKHGAGIWEQVSWPL